MSKQQRSSSLGWKYWVLPTCFLLGGLLFVYHGQVLRKKESDIKQWPVTCGVIESIGIGQYYKGRLRPDIYGLAVSYHYQVGGKIYHSNRITINGNYESDRQFEVQKLKGELEFTKELQVYYNPLDPSESLLFQKGIQNFYLDDLGLGISLEFIGLMIMVFYFRMVFKRA